MTEGVSLEDEGYFQESDYIEITNEFASVRIRKVRTRDGNRLEISSPKLGFKNYFDALQLEALTWCDKNVFSRLLSTPWGPNKAEREASLELSN